MTVCFDHVTYVFQGESTPYVCLNVEELLAQNRRHIWSLRDCNRTRTHNHLVRKQHWPVWLNGWVFVYDLSSCGFESLCSHKSGMYEKQLLSIVPDQVIVFAKIVFVQLPLMKEIWGGCSNIKPFPFGINSEAACLPVSGADSFFSEGVPNSPVEDVI